MVLIFLKVCTEMIIQLKDYQPKINRLQYTSILSKLQKDMELVSSLHSRGKNKLEMLVISCIHFDTN